ncbi:hypothetical protein SAPIO_CDS0114 [Scedosporium apiospermum]|uniref:CFEM domain-containing protein n=1 Tax=Pseudallescheria apiosperma TaxID=563466 RepID=A0A084GHJ9_PSEDA|nr:uncharacterized protein SAPIO_CDS0114 [Scedosporium apiospermum]KEZ46811.1 hypothetical protein SAPIO_CDS0114 [Scedosporium apiospermum]
MHHRLSTILLLAGLATERASAAIPNLTQCQSRCFDLTAQMVGCGKEDYACQCPIFNEQFIPQMQSCMIEGCAFDSEPLNTTQLQSTVCALAGGQSQAPTPTSGSPSGSEPQPSETPSATSPGSSESPGTDTLPSAPSTSTTSSPESTSDSHGGGSGSTNSPEPSGEAGAASAFRVLDAGVVTGVLAVLAGAYFF